MLTGDSDRAAAAVAQNLGIERVVSQAKPETKLKAIKSLQVGAGFCFCINIVLRK
jgi:cation transport ATPase